MYTFCSGEQLDEVVVAFVTKAWTKIKASVTIGDLKYSQKPPPALLTRKGRLSSELRIDNSGRVVQSQFPLDVCENLTEDAEVY